MSTHTTADTPVTCTGCGIECDPADAIADDSGLAWCGSVYGNGCALRCDCCGEPAGAPFEQGGHWHTLCDACERETRPEECAHDNVDALGDEVWCEDCGEGLDSFDPEEAAQ